MAGSCDDVYYDAERKRIYAIGGEGFISVVQQNDPDHYTLSANIPLCSGRAHGIFFGTSLYVGVWFPYLRFYSPTDAFFNQTWKPDDIVEMN